MIYRLPPLNALRVFETAARHLSFKEAAQELSITQAAVSHQIKSLEEYLGVELFRRAGRGVQLTEAARACLPKLREGFESLAAAVELIRERAAETELMITAPPVFTARWLFPRLADFAKRGTSVELRAFGPRLAKAAPPRHSHRPAEHTAQPRTTPQPLSSGPPRKQNAPLLPTSTTTS